MVFPSSHPTLPPPHTPNPQRKREKQEALLAEAAAEAERDFDQQEAEKQAAAWAHFRRQRPLRMKLYRRSLKSAQEGVGCRLPETPLSGRPSVREEQRLELEYARLLALERRVEERVAAAREYREQSQSKSQSQGSVGSSVESF